MNYNEVVIFRVSKQERSLLEEMAQKEGRTLSSMFRRLVIEGANHRNLQEVEGQGDRAGDLVRVQA